MLEKKIELTNIQIEEIDTQSVTDKHLLIIISICLSISGQSYHIGSSDLRLFYYGVKQFRIDLFMGRVIIRLVKRRCGVGRGW